MNDYITRFISTLPAAQRQAIQAVISKDIAQGNTPTFDELLRRFDEIGQQTIDGITPKPIVQSFATRSAGMTSRLLNDFADFIGYDLRAVYIELNRLSEAFEGMRRFNEVDKLSIERRLGELDNALTLGEILDDKRQDLYTLSLFNTFDSADSYSLPITSPLSSYLYTDPRTKLPLEAGDIISIDSEREGAVLAANSIDNASFRSVFVSKGSNTTESDINFVPIAMNNLTSIPANDIKNLEIDDDKVWAHYVFKAKTNKRQTPLDAVTAEVILDFGGIRSVNALSLSISSPDTLTVESVAYEAPDGLIYYIISEAFDIIRSVNLTFSRVNASRIFIKFQQSNYTTIETSIKNINNSPYIELPMSHSAKYGGADKLAISNASGEPNLTSKVLSGWLYTISIDKIVASTSNYRDFGVFVSAPLRLTGTPERIALDSLYERSTTSGLLPKDVIEFYATIFEYDANDNLLERLQVPLMPLSDQLVIEHEMLSLSSSGVSTLRFFPDVDEAFTVYRDYTPLVPGTDYKISVDNGTTYEDQIQYLSSPSGPRYDYNILINNFSNTSAYTVSYTAQSETIATGFPLYVDSIGIIVIEADGSLSFDYPSNRTQRIARTDVYLSFIVRSIHYDSALRETPIVFDYTLFVR